MPFTPAHPAIALPFLRWRYVSATALIIGSMAPDFEYFLRMSTVNGEHGHSLAGIFYFDIPVTLFLAYIFHRFVKGNLISNLPAYLQRRLSDLKQFDFENYLRKHVLIFVISAVIGSASHILWDSFTHPRTWIVENLSIYKTILVPLDGVKYPLYYALQHFSSYIGLTLMLVYTLKFKSGTPVTIVKPSIFYWIFIVAISLTVLFLRFNWLPETFNLSNFVVSSITAFCISLLIAGRVRYSATVDGQIST
jgi:hypothetical protein